MSPDRRTVAVADGPALEEAVLVAQAAGWDVLVARRAHPGLVLVLGRKPGA